MGAVLEEITGVRLPTAAASGRGIAAATGRLGALVRVGVQRECARGAATPGTVLRLACSGHDDGVAVAMAVDGQEVGTVELVGSALRGLFLDGDGVAPASVAARLHYFYRRACLTASTTPGEFHAGGGVGTQGAGARRRPPSRGKLPGGQEGDRGARLAPRCRPKGARRARRPRATGRGDGCRCRDNCWWRGHGHGYLLLWIWLCTSRQRLDAARMTTARCGVGQAERRGVGWMLSRGAQGRESAGQETGRQPPAGRAGGGRGTCQVGLLD